MTKVRITKEAAEQLEGLQEPHHARMLRLFDRLERWPEISGAKALSGDLAGWYRMRSGDYRLRFFVKGADVVVDKIGHRRDFCEG
ncbi:MAG: type II toxin-antitoxin system RelE/ParE family toxin [Gemmataceae bacterium]